MQEFKKELEGLINKHSIENYCDMPDFLIAEMLCGLIEIIGIKSKQNLDWHGCDSVCHPKIVGHPWMFQKEFEKVTTLKENQND